MKDLMATTHDLTAQIDGLFNARSVAVVSVPRGLKTGSVFLTALLDQGYNGRIYPVNPLADEISSFALSIRDGLPPRVSGEDAKRALEHALKIRESMFIPPINADNTREEPAC